MDAYQILVISLSVLLAIFLTLSIICLVFVIKLVKKVDEAVGVAKHAADNVMSMTHSIKNVADGTLLSVIAAKVWDKVKANKSKKGR